MNGIITNPIKQTVGQAIGQTKEKRNIANSISNIVNSINSLGFITERDKEFSFSDHIYYLLKASESSDQKIKSKIENHIVKMGEKAVPVLVKSLTETTGSTRGLVAMALIRIGKSSLNYLEQMASVNPEFKWVSEYVTEEIKGSQIKLKTVSIIENSFEEVLAG